MATIFAAATLNAFTSPFRQRPPSNAATIYWQIGGLIRGGLLYKHIEKVIYLHASRNCYHNTCTHWCCFNLSTSVLNRLLYCNFKILWNPVCRLGSWQFLVDMPYRGVSLTMMWRLLWLMHYASHKDKKLESGDLLVSAEECLDNLKGSSWTSAMR